MRRGTCGAIVHFADGAGERSAVDVDVPDREEDVIRVPGGQPFLVGDDDNSAIGRRDDSVRIGGMARSGSRKKEKTKTARAMRMAAAIHQWRARVMPRKEWRQTEVVAFLHHV